LIPRNISKVSNDARNDVAKPHVKQHGLWYLTPLFSPKNPPKKVRGISSVVMMEGRVNAKYKALQAEIHIWM
jgi:hypothetical protein